jgi:hypothetical protein
MPMLPNPRHELYAEKLATGMSQTAAYIAAGYRETPQSRTYASRLAAKDNIRQRVSELQTRNVQKMDAMAEMTTQRLLAMAEEARVLAMKQNQPAAAVTALTAIAKLSGLWVERSEQTTKTGSLEDLTDDELAAIIRQGQPDSAPPKPGSKKLN